MSPAMWFSMSSLFLSLFLSFLLLLLLHLSSLLISLFLFSFPSSATPHPIFVSLFFSSTSLLSLSFSFPYVFPLSSPSHSSHPTYLSFHFSQDTHPTTSICPIPFVVPTDLSESILHRPLPLTNTHSMVTRSKVRFYKPKALVTTLDSPIELALFEFVSFAKQSNMLTSKMLGLQNTRLLLKMILGH